MSVEQGEVYWADLNPATGREQRGRRPVLVVSRNEVNRLPLTVLVMAGSGAEHYATQKRFPTDIWVGAQESGLPKDTVFLGLQLRSLDRSRLTGPLGKLPAHRLPEVWDAIRYVMGDDRAG